MASLFETQAEQHGFAEFSLLEPVPMKLAQLLEKDQSSNKPEVLQKNFGDAYLIQHNRIFAKIRKATLTSGFQYSLEKNEAYYALPLTQLEAVLESKTIPYIDNRSVLQKLESHHPSVIFWDDIMDGLKKNHVFHESCHAVARQVIQRHSTGLVNSNENTILKMLLEESFSNTCELLAVTDVTDNSHRIFFEWNSYVCMFEDRTNLKKAQESMGEALVFRFMLFSYLHSNFLCEGMSDKTFQSILKLIPEAQKLSEQHAKILRSFAKIAFKLNPRFREVTTGFHLRLQGFKAPLRKSLDFDFMDLITRGPAYQMMIAELVGSIV